MAPVSHGTSACASSAFAPPTTNKIGAMGAMVPAYFSMTGPPHTALYKTCQDDAGTVLQAETLGQPL